MTTYKITASSISYHTATIEADTEAEAWATARDMDGADFDRQGEGDWTISDVEYSGPVRMAYAERFALGQWLVDYPRTMTYAAILQRLASPDYSGITINEFTEGVPAHTAELIRRTCAAFDNAADSLSPLTLSGQHENPDMNRNN